MTKTTFNTVDILSCSTDRLFGEMSGVYKVAEFLTASDVWTHQLLLIAEPMRRVLKRAIPNLPGPEDTAGVTHDNVVTHRDRWIAKLGPTITLPEELFGCLSNGSPLADLKKLRPDAEIVIVGGPSHDPA